MIPFLLIETLAQQGCLRGDLISVESVVSPLSCNPKSDFCEFFKRFKGPVGSEGIGYELLDLIEDEPSIVTSTKAIRDRFALPSQYLVISDYLAGGVLVYDCVTDYVYDLDFEGGMEQLLNNDLSPRWESFLAFLLEYFCIR